MAREQYQSEGDELKAQYAMIGDQRNTEYNKYRDSLSDWNYNQEVARKLEAEEYNRQTTAKQQAYANLYALISASGYVPTDAELANAGMTAEAANALRTEYLVRPGSLWLPAVVVVAAAIQSQVEQAVLELSLSAIRDNNNDNRQSDQTVLNFLLSNIKFKIKLQ